MPLRFAIRDDFRGVEDGVVVVVVFVEGEAVDEGVAMAAGPDVLLSLSGANAYA